MEHHIGKAVVPVEQNLPGQEIGILLSEISRNMGITGMVPVGIRTSGGIRFVELPQKPAQGFAEPFGIVPIFRMQAILAGDGPGHQPVPLQGKIVEDFRPQLPAVEKSSHLRFFFQASWGSGFDVEAAIDMGKPDSGGIGAAAVKQGSIPDIFLQRFRKTGDPADRCFVHKLTSGECCLNYTAKAGICPEKKKGMLVLCENFPLLSPTYCDIIN